MKIPAKKIIVYMNGTSFGIRLGFIGQFEYGLASPIRIWNGKNIGKVISKDNERRKNEENNGCNAVEHVGPFCLFSKGEYGR